MAFTKDSGRQNVKYAEALIGFADLTTGVAKAVVKLPLGASVLSGDVVVDTAWDSATSAVMVVGDASTANRYFASASIKTAGRTALVPTGFVTTITQPNVEATITVVGATTAGSLRVRVAYVAANRADENQD